MPTTPRRWRERRTLWFWCAVAMLPFVLAGTCFDTSTAPDVITPGDTVADTTSTSTL